MSFSPLLSTTLVRLQFHLLLSIFHQISLSKTDIVAVEHYTKCLDGLKRRNEAQSDLAMKAHANRAACYKQISNFDGVIEDCSAVLECDPENVKALVRRAQAFEGVERYRFALQDVKTVLAMPFAKVGKANMDMCNMMQHRLNRTVQQLKAGNN
jgi:stress-induced-phosphoprotein 1